MPVEISTAENVSNLTWVVFAAASLMLWRFWVLPQLGARFQRSLGALLCVLLLMFPIISISDDLHPDMVAAVEGESKSRLLKPADTSHQAAGPAAHPTIGTLMPAGASLSPGMVTVVGRLRPLMVRVKPRFHVQCVSFRGPPSAQDS